MVLRRGRRRRRGRKKVKKLFFISSKTSPSFQETFFSFPTGEQGGKFTPPNKDHSVSRVPPLVIGWKRGFSWGPSFRYAFSLEFFSFSSLSFRIFPFFLPWLFQFFFDVSFVFYKFKCVFTVDAENERARSSGNRGSPRAARGPLGLLARRPSLLGRSPARRRRRRRRRPLLAPSLRVPLPAPP